jgi:carbon-monoxide dehydrogenase medium subunit
VYAAEFGYQRAGSVEHALAALADGAGEVKVLAGGQSLLPMMKLRLAMPDLLVDIGGLAELATIEVSPQRTVLGAVATYRSLERDPLAGKAFPAMADALAVLADPQVRARGTVGGAVAHADPAADLPAVLLALDAELTVARRSATRTVPIDRFLRGVFATDLAEDEVLTRITVPAAGPGQAYQKFEQPASHLPLAGVCAAVEVTEGVISSARIAVTGVAGRPFRARRAERALAGAPPDPDALRGAAALVREEPVQPLQDQHAGGQFRLHLAGVLAGRALARAVARAVRP